jgi:hypothetical protein
MTTPYASYLNIELQKAINDAKKYADEAVGVFSTLRRRLIIDALKNFDSTWGMKVLYDDFADATESIGNLSVKVQQAQSEQAELTIF